MDEAYIGSIVLFAGNFAPRGWAFCDGATLNVNQYTALYAILGTTYGGNGQTTFSLPDLRGRVVAHAGGGGGAPGVTPVSLGQSGGNSSVTLNTNNMPSHSHALQIATQDATGNTAGNTVVLGTPNGQTSQSLEAVTVNNVVTASGATLTPLSPDAISTAGGSQPVTVMPPYLGLNYIICLQGLFPSRN